MKWVGSIYRDGTIHIEEYGMMEKREMANCGFMEERNPFIAFNIETVEADTIEEAEDKLKDIMTQRFHKIIHGNKEVKQ